VLSRCPRIVLPHLFQTTASTLDGRKLLISWLTLPIFIHYPTTQRDHSPDNVKFPYISLTVRGTRHVKCYSYHACTSVTVSGRGRNATVHDPKAYSLVLFIWPTTPPFLWGQQTFCTKIAHCFHGSSDILFIRSYLVEHSSSSATQSPLTLEQFKCLLKASLFVGLTALCYLCILKCLFIIIIIIFNI